jgi:hypothetical protein
MVIVRFQKNITRFMGASGWSYFVPYEEDTSAALQRLREDIFARGEYVTDDDILESVDWEAAARRYARSPRVSEDMKRRHLAEAERLRKLRQEEGELPKPPSPPKPDSIEALLEEQAENGTHSILDITCVSSRPKFGAVSPFPSSKLVEYFNTDKPDHAVIEDRYQWGSLEKFTSKRWQGIYIIAYKDGKPDEIFFAGCSGD